MVDRLKRKILKRGLIGLSALGGGVVWAKSPSGNVAVGGIERKAIAGLQPADKNDVRMLAGMSSRIVARSSQTVLDDKAYRWHAAPDGGACFATPGGGWVYVSNCEMKRGGGAGALVFDADARITDAYSVLDETSNNCAGGATPWGSWLSCEEVKRGRVWECDPLGKNAAIVRPALGVFKHEAVAVDTQTGHLYLTEDERDGCLYRFVADKKSSQGWPVLSDGRLEVALAVNGKLEWVALPDPLATDIPTRQQRPEAKIFNGGEGIAYHEGKIIFTTKGDNRVWLYDTIDRNLTILYDAADYVTPVLTGVDNVAVSQNGEIYIAEDGGDLQIVLVNAAGRPYPVVELVGHNRSEITGPAFSPDGRRLYFSSQRGSTGRSEDGVTYEITGF